MQDVVPLRKRAARKAEGQERRDERRTWCRVQFVLSMVAPAPGKLLSVDRGPKTLRITACAPSLLMAALATAFFSSHPAAWKLIQWVAAVMGHPL